jgi:hypothetical protein
MCRKILGIQPKSTRPCMAILLPSLLSAVRSWVSNQSQPDHAWPFPSLAQACTRWRQCVCRREGFAMLYTCVCSNAQGGARVLAGVQCLECSSMFYGLALPLARQRCTAATRSQDLFLHSFSNTMGTIGNSIKTALKGTLQHQRKPHASRSHHMIQHAQGTAPGSPGPPPRN